MKISITSGQAFTYKYINFLKKGVDYMGQPQCESCCEDTDILCVSIPGGVHIVLLGIHIDLEALCLRISNPGPGTLTAAQQANVEQVAGAVGNLLGNLLPRA